MTNLVKQWGAPHSDRRSRVPTSIMKGINIFTDNVIKDFFI
jgi:hypothetical protein